MKKLSLIYAAGMYESRGEIGGLFLGSGDSLLLGKYRGTSESQLSKMVGPPRKVRYVVPVNLWLTGFFVVMAFAGRGKLSSVTGFLSTVYVLLFPGYIVAGLLHSFFIYSPKFLTWDQKFMCQRCGATIKETSHTV
jgi:hypothetical protein